MCSIIAKILSFIIDYIKREWIDFNCYFINEKNETKQWDNQSIG